MGGKTDQSALSSVGCRGVGSVFDVGGVTCEVYVVKGQDIKRVTNKRRGGDGATLSCPRRGPQAGAASAAPGLQPCPAAELRGVSHTMKECAPAVGQ